MALHIPHRLDLIKRAAKNRFFYDDLYHVPWLMLLVSWMASTWIGLEILGAVYEGTLTGNWVSGLLADRGVRPLSYYQKILWLLTTGVHLVGLILLSVVYTWRLHSVLLLLGTLLVGDVYFIASSLYVGSWLSVREDGQLPEIYQYLKLLGIAAGFAWLYLHRPRSPVLVVFAGLFAWLFIDDAFQYHERVGTLLAAHFDFTQLSARFDGIRQQEAGEIFSLIGPLCIFGPAFAYTYVKDEGFGRRVFHRLILLVGLLGLCGIVVDVLYRMNKEKTLQSFLGHLEDGGEMVVVSIMASYAASLVWAHTRPNHPSIK